MFIQNAEYKHSGEYISQIFIYLFIFLAVMVIYYISCKEVHHAIAQMADKVALSRSYTC